MSANKNNGKAIHLDNEIFVTTLINYLGVLQEGRIKPNTNPNAESTVRDSIDNLGDITGVKQRLNEIFDLDIEKIDIINGKRKY